MITSAFSKPEKLIQRAHRALDEADAAIRATFVPENAALVVEDDKETGEKVKKMRLLVGLHDAVEEHITNALNNSRNAFDQMLFAACGVIKRPLKDGHYPWADSPTQLNDWKLRNKKTGKETIPREFWDLIRRQQPYPAGDGYSGGLTLERSIATYANRKHTIGLDIAATVTGYVGGNAFISNAESFRVPVPTWDPKKNEMELARWKGGQAQFGDNYTFAFYVIFDASAPPELRNWAASDAVRRFAAHAQFCLDGFKAEAAKILGS